MSVKVKICGHTNYEDALASAEAGADMVGFIFYLKSKRFITFERAAEWLGRLPSHCLRVGVFVDAPAEDIQSILRSGLIDQAQLHGSETPEFCQALGVPFFKALRIHDKSSVESIGQYDSEIILLDSPAPGSGEVCNWDYARLAVCANPSHHVLLAGGLTPENVRRAVETIQPWGVDVATGVEAMPGVKDLRKVREFIAQAKASG
ncbi:MAG: phosphoribosylanthranilate isomerase [Verrucomicrobiales bacterium]